MLRLVSDLMEKKTLTFEFENAQAAKHFALWLCEQGEQDYWDWMEEREQGEDGDITALRFEYHSPQNEEFERNDERRYKGAKFLGDGIIRTECGRLDR